MCTVHSHTGRFPILNGSMFSSKIEIRSESIMKDYLYHDMGHMNQIRKVISVCLFFVFVCVSIYAMYVCGECPKYLAVRFSIE